MKKMTLAITCLCFPLILYAQLVRGSFQKTQGNKPNIQSSQLGSIEGRVFAITREGDLKPARLAKIELFFEDRTSNHKVVPTPEAESVYLFFLTKLLEKKQIQRSRNQNAPVDYSISNEVDEERACQEKLQEIDGSILETLEWVQENNKANRIASVDTDEEGNFRLSKLGFGKYRLLARGRVGAYDAYWEEEIWIENRTPVTAKMGKVDTACLIPR